jgi:hypothetical protein
MAEKQKPTKFYVTKLNKGQKVKFGEKEIEIKNDETSIYISEDVTLKKGDKLYLNKVSDIVTRLQADDKISEEQASDWLARSKQYNQTHEVSIFRKK